MDKNEIISRIEKYRIAKGLTNNKLNDLAGFPQSMIYQWYSTSRMPTLRTIEDICNALGISLSEFFYEGKEGESSLQDREMMDVFSTLTDEEKIYIVQMAKGLRDMNHSSKSDENKH